jgi:catechol 2,3-dioxygenase-like lactoylglutathione lyase family enzyme
MFSGAHVLLYSRDPDADRAFFKDVLDFPAVDAGHGWLIFRLPPSEMALHPHDDKAEAPDGPDRVLGGDLYLMCDDVRAVIASLEAKQVACAPVVQERWGLRTSIRLPSGGAVGLYQPSHPTAYDAALGG